MIQVLLSSVTTSFGSKPVYEVVKEVGHVLKGLWLKSSCDWLPLVVTVYNPTVTGSVGSVVTDYSLAVIGYHHLVLTV